MIRDTRLIHPLFLPKGRLHRMTKKDTPGVINTAGFSLRPDSNIENREGRPINSVNSDLVGRPKASHSSIVGKTFRPFVRSARTPGASSRTSYSEWNDNTPARMGVRGKYNGQACRESGERLDGNLGVFSHKFRQRSDGQS